MARAEKTPISIPDGVCVDIEGQRVTVKGARGQLAREFPSCVGICRDAEDAIRLSAREESRLAVALVGTVKSLIQGMMRGVSQGYVKNLEISGVGFKATLKGATLDLALGKSHPINYLIPDSIKITVAENVKVCVEGIDKQLVGQVAADIRAFYPAEPYKGKGVRIVGQFVRRKAGKKTA
ncbi:MAG: 50S ribosomal protein L6 [Puniceicoccales bacterium]|jgi:large subunit ribosomal protein L6|nr:50S ribosomal protein L6 [Puniceicoccales bacterium]